MPTTSENKLGSCTVEEILREVPEEHWDAPCLYLVLLYLPDLRRWVTKWGHTDVGLRKRLKGLNSEYVVHMDRYYRDEIPRIVPLFLAKNNAPGLVPSVIESRLKVALKEYTVPVQRKFTKKQESGRDHAAIYDAFKKFLATEDCKTLFESERCLVDEQYVKYDETYVHREPGFKSSPRK